MEPMCYSVIVNLRHRRTNIDSGKPLLVVGNRVGGNPRTSRLDSDSKIYWLTKGRYVRYGDQTLLYGRRIMLAYDSLAYRLAFRLLDNRTFSACMDRDEFPVYFRAAKHDRFIPLRHLRRLRAASTLLSLIGWRAVTGELYFQFGAILSKNWPLVVYLRRSDEGRFLPSE